MTRWRAAGTHLALSVVVIGGIALAAFLLWYPYDLYKVAGLDRILLVMLGIDLTAGPLLTLILYKPGKWGLKFDLYAVALAQLMFLSYGLHTLWQGRPIFLVGTPETYTVVFASEVSDEDLALASEPRWRKRSVTGPQLVATRMPADPKKRQAIIGEFMAGGAGIERSPKYYMDLASVAGDILEKSTPATHEHSGAKEESRAGASVRVVPVVSRRGSGTILVDPVTATPIRVLSTDRVR